MPYIVIGNFILPIKAAVHKIYIFGGKKQASNGPEYNLLLPSIYTINTYTQRHMHTHHHVITMLSIIMNDFDLTF